MAFLIYFFVLLVSAASVLFGLDLMSSPLPKTPNVPIGRSVQVTSQMPAQEPQKKAADEQALTPVYPTTPGVRKVETSGAASQQDAKLTPPPAEPAPVTTQPAPSPPSPPVATQPAQPAPAATVAQTTPQNTQQPSAPPAAAVTQNAPPPAQAPAAAQAPAPEQQAKTAEPVATAQPAAAEAKVEPAATEAKEAKVEPTATPQPMKKSASNSCNVQACSAAYQSFRASDCTYQPYGGERRLCSMTAGAMTARAARPEQSSRRSSDQDDVRDVERTVRRQPLELRPSAARRAATPTRGEMTEVERIVRHMTRDEAADIPVEDADGRVFIVRKSYR
jgi:hypothetical protein